MESEMENGTTRACSLDIVLPRSYGLLEISTSCLYYIRRTAPF